MAEPRRVMIAPWLNLASERQIGRVQFMPRAQAVAAAGDVAKNLHLRTEMFVDSDAIATHLGNGSPIRPLNSAIAFLDNVEEHEARRALDALCFATIATNDPPVAYANGTTFFRMIQNLGGEPNFIAERRPRLHGYVVDGYSIDNMYNARPRHAEKFHNGADTGFVSALAAAAQREPNIGYALDIVRMAASDSPDVDLTLAKSLYAAATMRALAKPGGSDSFKDVRDQIQSLLFPILGRGTSGDDLEYHIVQAWKSVRDDRNDWWHIDAMKTNSFPFERQTTVRPHLIAFRMVQALLVARLVEMRLLKASDSREIVGAIEDWIALIAEFDPRDPNEAHKLRPFALVHRDAATLARAKTRMEYMRRHGTLAGWS